jgi:sulfate transport system substrate-binding protein
MKNGGQVMNILRNVGLAAALGLTLAGQAMAEGKIELLNVSYDPTRELYQELNGAFAKQWQAKSGQALTVEQSHGGSGKQARSVIDGLQADVVTLALAADIDAIAAKGLIAQDWQKRLPSNSCPYTSTIVFLVRKGNPKGIHDWGDLLKPGIAVVTPNPKTSGGARWTYLAAWAWALEQPGGNEEKARETIAALYKNVPILDTGARASTITFMERGIGDVLVAWEDEALLVTRKLKPGQFEIVVPSMSILAEPPVAWVDAVVKKKGTAEAAKAYLEFLYTPEAQEVIGRHFYRPSVEAVAQKFKDRFPDIKRVSVDKVFGGWANAQKVHFADGGEFDKLYKGGAR